MGLTKRTFWQHPAFGDRRWRLFAALPSTRRGAPPVDLADMPHLDGWLVARDEAGSEWRRTQRQFRRCRVAAGARFD